MELHQAVNVGNLDDRLLQKFPIIRFGLGHKGEYTGNVLLTFRANTKDELERLRRRVNLLPNTLLSFAGSSGFTLKVVLHFTRPDGTLPHCRKLSIDELAVPQTFSDDAVLFHEYALNHAAQVLQMQLGRWAQIPSGGGRPETGCRISADPALYHNPKAVTILLEQPSEPLDPALAAHSVEKPMPALKGMPEVEEIADEAMRFQWCLMKVRRMGTMPRDIFYQTLAAYCFNNNVDGNFALFRLKLREDYNSEIKLAALCFLNVYEDKRVATHKAMTAKDMQVYGMEDYLQDHYLFRCNALTGQEEYVDRNLYSTRWQAVTERLVNTIVIDLQKGWYHDVWDKDVWRYIRSHYIQTYNPIDEYLDSLPQWDGIDRVETLAATVTTRNKYWACDFHTWLLGMVSQWMGRNRSHPVSMTPMLISPQGAGKSTFCRHLLPPELRPYYVEHLDFLNKENAERALSRFCLINLDEFDKITKRQMTFLKYIQTLRESQTRQMYTTNVNIRNRYAAFIATTNSMAPLQDDSGSRRYLCIEISKINQDLLPDYPQLYAQLKAEVLRGDKVYFTSDEEKRIQEANQEFQYPDDNHEYLLEMFMKTPTKDNALRMTPLEIAEYIHKVHPAYKVTHENVIRIGKLLHQNDFLTIRSHGLRYYFLKKQVSQSF